MDGQPGVPLEALPVKAADGTLHYIKSTKKERREADVAKAAREQADARSAKAKADKKGSKGGNTRADVSASTSDGAARDKQKDGGSSAEKEKAAEGGDGGVGKGAGTSPSKTPVMMLVALRGRAARMAQTASKTGVTNSLLAYTP
jgi:hypothetical protein